MAASKYNAGAIFVVFRCGSSFDALSCLTDAKVNASHEARSRACYGPGDDVLGDGVKVREVGPEK